MGLADFEQDRTMQQKGSQVLLLIISVAVGGCTGSLSMLGAADEEPEAFPILWERAGSYCSRETPLRLVARSRAEMALCPVADVPVDFSREMVLAVAMGRVTSDRYAIRIHRVWREESVLKVDVRVHRPPPSTQPSIRLACPYHVVVVQRSRLNVEGFWPDPRRATRSRGRL